MGRSRRKVNHRLDGSISDKQRNSLSAKPIICYLLTVRLHEQTQGVETELINERINSQR